MKKNFLLVIITLICSVLYGQKENNIWYFGDHAGIDFNGPLPVAITNGAMYAWDYASTISDSNGSVLFYTNGMEVWNKNHLTMVNGTGLLGNNSSGQAALIVPEPNSNFYYIFTVDNFAGNNGFRYHIVDMTLNGGLGEVISKNNILFTPSTERIDAVYNPLTNDYWIITHEWNSNNFRSYFLDTSGLATTAVISSVGQTHSGGSPTGYNAIGQLTISPKADRLVCAIYSMGTFEVFDFDINTGIISNPQTINGYGNAFGTAFSPDGSKLYITQLFSQNIYQFDLNAGSWSQVIASATLVGISNGPGTSGYYSCYPELAPDNKIYIAVFNDIYLSVINYPDSAGTQCGFIDNGFYLGGKLSNAGLSRSIRHSSLPVVALSSSDTVMCKKTCIDFFDLSTNSPNSWNWYFPNASPDTSTSQNPTNICYNYSGNYDVIFIACNSIGCDSIHLTNFIQIISSQAPVITISNDTLFSTHALNYTWYEISNPSQILSNDSFLVLNQSGSYYVVTIDSNGCNDVSNVIAFTSISNLVPDDTFPVNISYDQYSSVEVTISSMNKAPLIVNITDMVGRSVLHSKLSHQQSRSKITKLSPGMYTVSIIQDSRIFNKKIFIHY